MEFAITVKFVSKAMRNCTPEDYDKLFDEWRDKYNVIMLSRFFEPDTKGVCHCHGIIHVPNSFYRKNLMQKGLHYDMQQIYDRSGWLAYSKKFQNRRMFTPDKDVPTQTLESLADGLSENDSGPLSVEDSPIDNSDLIAMLNRNKLF